MNEKLVAEAQEVFKPVYDKTQGNTGYVSFELDPLIEDVNEPIPHAERVKQYIECGTSTPGRSINFRRKGFSMRSTGKSTRRNSKRR